MFGRYYHTYFAQREEYDMATNELTKVFKYGVDMNT